MVQHHPGTTDLTVVTAIDMLVTDPLSAHCSAQAHEITALL